MLNSRAWRRRLLVGVAGVLAVAASFSLGYDTGNSRPPPPPQAKRSLVEEAADAIRERAAGAVDDAALSRAAIEGMLSALGDPYAAYLPVKAFADYEALLDGRYAGVGLWVARDPQGVVSITSVVPDSPASRAGVLIGDILVSVDGEPVGRRGTGELVAALRGAPGTRVRVVVTREGAVRTLSLRRGEVDASDVTVDRPSPRVARIRVDAFTRGVGRRVVEEARTLSTAGLRGIVIDLRGNPGGLLEEAVEAAGAFLAGGEVVSYRGRGVTQTRYPAGERGDTTTSLVVLVDGGTASAAEVLAGALQDRDRAVIVGSQTYGKGSVQLPLALSDGSALQVTVGLYYLPSGRTIDRVGLTPDVEVAPRLALRRALQVLTAAA